MSNFSSKRTFLCLICLLAVALVPQAQAAGDIKPGAAPKLHPNDYPLSEVEHWTSPRVDVEVLVDVLGRVDVLGKVDVLGRVDMLGAGLLTPPTRRP